MEFMTSGCCSMLRWICRRSATSCPAYSLDRCASAAHVAFNSPGLLLAVDLPVDEGGLIAYGVSTPENFRRSASYVDKILKGTKPGT